MQCEMIASVTKWVLMHEDIICNWFCNGFTFFIFFQLKFVLRIHSMVKLTLCGLCTKIALVEVTNARNGNMGKVFTPNSIKKSF